jgi:hypothetical protein
MAHKLMNVSLTQQVANLDTTRSNGDRESAIWIPRQEIELSDAQFNSREVQKLLGAKLLIDRTAMAARR